MTKVASPSVKIRPISVASAKATLGELVMAWARDNQTGEPRYIGEIGAEHRGGKCGCECPSCGLALIAVNAARDRVIRRPHFRHPEGAQRDDCAVLAARAVAIRLLADEGVIELPRRRMSATAVGLSGDAHEAWVEAPAQRVRVASIDYSDRAYATLTLDDGRKLRVLLTGHIAQQAGDDGDATLIPTITIDVDGSIAGMDQVEIRKRLQLLPDAICWRSHWNDPDLVADAQIKVTELAVDALDWLPDDVEIPEGLSPAMKRESLLHHEVKRILERAGQITVPGLVVLEELRTAGHPTLQRSWSVGDRILELTNTRLEHRMRPLIPDVVSQARGQDGQLFDPLVIEVTVTNVIDDERKARIRAQGFAALEIDLSVTGGRVTRSQLHRLVVHEIAVKRWLHYPDLDTIRASLQKQMQAERDLCSEVARIAEERRGRILEAPITEVAARYLEAVEQMLVEQTRLGAGAAQKPEIVAAKSAVAISVDEMAQRGFAEAGDEDLLGHHRILSRLLSIRSNHGIGYSFSSAAEVLNAIQQSLPGNRNDWTLYLIAAKVYLPRLSEDQRIWSWFKVWRDTVAAAIKRKDYVYMRSTKYDRLLTLLFPEMADGLANRFGTRPVVADLRWDESKNRIERAFTESASRRAAFLSRDTAQHEPLRHGSDGGDVKDWFFKGAELAAWKCKNPGAAADWDATLKRFGID